MASHPSSVERKRGGGQEELKKRGRIDLEEEDRRIMKRKMKTRGWSLLRMSVDPPVHGL